MRTNVVVLMMTVLLAGCGLLPREEPKDESEPWEQVQLKMDRYHDFRSHIGYKNGFVHPIQDSTFLTGLANIAGWGADMSMVQRDDGKVFRSWDHGCYDRGECLRAECSRDQILVFSMERFIAGDRGSLRKIIEYAIDHGLKMCRGTDLGSIMISPSLLITIRAAYEKLGGNQHFEIDQTPGGIGFDDGDSGYDIEFPALMLYDYTDHLSIIHDWFRALVYGGASDGERDTFRKKWEDQNRNAIAGALYHRYSDGEQDEVYEILLDESLFPSDRLPDERDRCAHYLWERDQNSSDWQPCDDPQTSPSPAVDFSIAAAISLNLIP